MRELDLTSIEMAGINLIEASAGTGKTYSITSLYIRMILELELLPEQILVVTYTEAATKELKGRIRTRVRDAITFLSSETSGDQFFTDYFCNMPEEKRSSHKLKLEKTLTLFDTAAIHTIHGFSLRALEDNAFESNAPFEAELLADEKLFFQEIVDDFWRSRFFGGHSKLLYTLLQQKCTVGTLTKFAQRFLKNVNVIIKPHITSETIICNEEDCQTKYMLLCNKWQEERAAISQIFSDKASALSRDKGKGKFAIDLIPSLLEEMDIYCSAGNCYDLPKNFDHFTRTGIERRLKKTGTYPSHPIFELCETIFEAVSKRLLHLHGELLDYCKKELAKRKKERQLRFFDDLLRDLHAGLCGNKGNSLIQKLRTRFRAALIDEFQDTDPLQYDIFRRIYSGTGQPLFLIGDPKQAIYSFRGADVFAYLGAVDGTLQEKQFTLTGNWRSSPELLQAFNTLFNKHNPFLFPQIAYHEVYSAKQKPLQSSIEPSKDPLTDSTPLINQNPALSLWLVPPGDDGKPIGVGAANKMIAASVAGEIVQLLDAGNDAGDVAVIVRSHSQAGYIQKALRTVGIPSVTRSDMSVFATKEAGELLILMKSFANPGYEPGLRTLLTTDLFGFNGDDLAELLYNGQGERRYEELLERFFNYHKIWQEKGFMSAVRLCMAEFRIRRELLDFNDGERRLTNLLHCCELLHEQETNNNRQSMESLTAWLRDRIERKDSDEAYQIRLETDNQAVKILTVHISKGLEFPIVFVPYLWIGIKASEEIISYHNQGEHVLDYGSESFHAMGKQASKESLAESLRLLYVALTRAKESCYLVAGKIVDKTGDKKKQSRPETSPIAYLLHADDKVRKSENLVEELAMHISLLSADDMRKELQEQADAAKGTIAVMTMPVPKTSTLNSETVKETPNLSCRIFERELSSHWRITSFSALSGHGKSESTKRDEPLNYLEDIENKSDTIKSMYTFPRGAKPGVCLHEIFEKLDFASKEPDSNNPLVSAALVKHGFESQWQTVISKMLVEVIKTPLQNQDGSLFSLSQLKPGSWITEMEFFLPLSFITSEEVGRLFIKHANISLNTALADSVAHLNFKAVSGMLRGFIDMIFEFGGRYYIVDWKSNHLGDSYTQYSQEHLNSAMTKNLYHLQYLIYAVALNRYLSIRIPDYSYKPCFGGIIYVFLRGVSAKQGENYGFYRNLPSEDFISELDTLLVNTKECQP